MALEHAECVKMVEVFRDAGLPLFVAYYRRALPRFLKVKELIEAGAIGDPRFVTITLHRPASAADGDPLQNWRIDPAISGGGYFVDLAAHQLDYLDYLFGPITDAKGLSANQGGLYAAEDIVSGNFRFANGVLGAGMWCFTSFDARDLIRIVGTRGRIEFSCFNENPITLATAEGVQSWAISNPEHVQQPLIQSIVDELLGRGECASKGESATRTAWVIDRLLGR